MDLASILSHAQQKVRRHGAAAGARTLALAALRRSITLERVHIYALQRDGHALARNEARGGHTRLATMEDLLPLTERADWQLGALGRAELEELASLGHRCVVNVVEGSIAGYCWRNPHQLVIPKVRAALALRSGEAHVYKDFTHPDYRGRRLGTLRYLHWLQEEPNCTPLTDFAFDNDATLARVRHLELDHVGTATYISLGDRDRLRLSPAVLGRRVTRVPASISQVDAARLTAVHPAA